MHRAIILAAGLGTRLRPLTDELPKPLVPLGDRPLLGHIAAQLREAGIASALINTHWLPEAFAPVLDRLAIPLEAIHEPVIRGTAGGIAGARGRIGPAPILVYNGDVVVQPPLERLLALGDEGLVLVAVPRPCDEGTVGVGARGEVVRLRGERFGQEVHGADYVGVASIGARCLDGLPASGCLIGDVALPALRRGERVQVLVHAGRFTDAGTPASYLAANLAWLAERRCVAWIAPSAEIDAGITVEDSVIGAKARVRGEGRLRRVVVWPDAEARAPLADAIVTRRGIVSTPPLPHESSR